MSSFYDKLDELVTKQSQLLSDYEQATGATPEPKDLVLAMMSELAEVLAETPWKPWKDYTGFEIDMAKLREESVDILFFLLELMIVHGKMTADDIFETYEKKLAVNRQRLVEYVEAKK